MIGNAPLPGSGIDADKVPGEVQTLSIPDLTRDRQTDVLANTVASQFAGVSLNDEQGSQFQPDFVYRGFEASPISGIAEGVAVYQDGVRLNESFGDNVNWDLVPQFAVRSPDPAEQRSGVRPQHDGRRRQPFDEERPGFPGRGFAALRRLLGNVSGDAEYGARFGDFGVYLGVGGVHDDGFRYRSPTTLRQGYGDVGYESGRADAASVGVRGGERYRGGGSHACGNAGAGSEIGLHLPAGHPQRDGADPAARHLARERTR